MKINIITPGSPYKTVMDIEQGVIIENPYVGPILTNGDLNVSVFARDDGFEGNVWIGEPDQMGILPAGATTFVIRRNGIITFGKQE